MLTYFDYTFQQLTILIGGLERFILIDPSNMIPWEVDVDSHGQVFINPNGP